MIDCRSLIACVLLALFAGPAMADGITPLHNAAADGDSVEIRALIAAGADVNARDGDGDVPLDYADRRSDRMLRDAMRQRRR